MPSALLPQMALHLISCCSLCTTTLLSVTPGTCMLANTNVVNNGVIVMFVWLGLATKSDSLR